MKVANVVGGSGSDERRGHDTTRNPPHRPREEAICDRVKAVTSSQHRPAIQHLTNRPASRSIGVAESDSEGSREGPGTPNTTGVSAMQNSFDTAAIDVVAQASTLNPSLNVSLWNLIAALAAVLSAVQLIPQARNAIKADELKGISLTTFLIISFTTLLWMLYGIHLVDIAIVVANGIACVCALTVSLIKIRSGSDFKRVPGTTAGPVGRTERSQGSWDDPGSSPVPQASRSPAVPRP
jgi:MtN3 and saliva related transmembrane protein